MDAFAITGVSPDHAWFRVEGAVGGEADRAQLFPRLHVVSSSDIADLASGGRKIYFIQGAGHNDGPLVPLDDDQAAAFDPAQLPLEQLPEFAFLENATDDDVQLLLALRHARRRPDTSTRRLARLAALGWIAKDSDGGIELTAVGRELLRHRLS